MLIFLPAPLKINEVTHANGIIPRAHVSCYRTFGIQPRYKSGKHHLEAQKRSRFQRDRFPVNR